MVGGMVLAVAGAVAVSPLAPVGPVRAVRPGPGIPGGPPGAGGRGRVLTVLLLGLLAGAGLAFGPPAAGHAGWQAVARRLAAAAVGLPVAAVVGVRAALERGSGQRRAPVLATLLGSAVAVLAVVMAAVFGASLNGLVTHPARYGWDWTLLMDTEGGYGSWPPAQMDKLVSGQPGVTGWSTFAFTQVPIDNTEVPVLGLTRYQGSVQPPTTSGHPVSGPRRSSWAPLPCARWASTWATR